MKESLATLACLALALGLGAPSSAQDASPETTQQKTNPAARTGKAATKAPWAGLDKRMASLTAEQLAAARKAYAHLTATCPVGSRMRGTLHALQKLYEEASRELTGLASAEGTAPAFKATLDKQVSMIAELAKANDAAIHVMKLLAPTRTAKTEPAKTEPAKTGATETESAKAEPTCSISAANKLVADWAVGRKAWAGMSAETRSELDRSFETLADLGLHVHGFVVDRLGKQNAILTKAMGSMSCPKTGFMAKSSEAIGACSASKAACTRAMDHLAIAHRLIRAVPIGSKESAAEGSSEAKTESPTTEAKVSTN